MVRLPKSPYRLDACAGGTRFTYDHTGFSGSGGFVMAIQN